MCIRDSYVAALEEALMTVDACLAFVNSDEGKAKFGDAAEGFKAHMESLKAAGAAVSYTHLDVYKRQALPRLCLELPPWVGSAT